MMEVEKLPKGWTVARLEEVCEILDGMRKPINATERANRIDGKNIKELYPYYGATGQVGLIDDFLLDGEFVLLGEDGAPFLNPFKNKSYLVRGKVWVNNHAHVLKSYFNNKYLNHYLNVVNYRNYVTGTTRLKLNQSAMKGISIPIAPLPEQTRILAKLEQLFTDLDKGIEYLKTAQQQLKIYRQAVLKWAFEGKLTNTKFDTVVTGDVIKTINNGYTPTKQFLTQGSGEIPFIKVYNLNFDGTLNFTKVPTFIPKAIHEKKLRRSICYPGDVLINIVGPPLGKVSIVSMQFPEWNINQAIVMFRPNEKVLSKYLSYFLQNHVTINWLEATSKATAGQWNVKVSTCREIPFPLCSPKEQEKIIREIESRLSVCDKIEETIENSLQQAEALRLSIIKKAFEGKLVPQDPKDEPAEKLLERIRALRQAQGKQGNGKPEKKEKVTVSKKKSFVNG